MFRASVATLKKRFPGGLDAKSFYAKINKPGSSKPWRNQNVAVDGVIEVSAVTPMHRPPSVQGFGQEPQSPMHMPGPFQEFLAEQRALTANGGPAQADAHDSAVATLSNVGALDALPAANTSGLTEYRLGTGEFGETVQPDLVYTGNELAGLNSAGAAATHLPASRGRDDASLRVSDDDPKAWQAALSTSVESRDPSDPLATVRVGKSLDVTVDKVTKFVAPQSLAVLKDTRTRREVAETIRLPRHINSLFHKIIGWSHELEGGLDDSTGLVSAPTRNSDAGSNSGSTDAELAHAGVGIDAPTPMLAKAEGAAGAQRRFAQTKEQLQYGVLMSQFENDQFALRHKLQVEGERLERKFTNWAGVKLLQGQPRDDLDDVRQNKSSLVCHGAGSFAIPKPGRDCCPGCGATFQEDDETQFGYVRVGNIANWVSEYHSSLQARADYADRMHELRKHWDTHGRRVGEEWLDFMTEEEFNAIYHFEGRPMVCDRCNSLGNSGTRSGRRCILQAADFSHELAALREKRCVTVLVIDLTDFPGTMVADLPGLISVNNPVIIAANKLDCINPRNFGYAGKNEAHRRVMVPRGHIRKWVAELAISFGLPRHQIKDIVPTSAVYGWGVDQLLTSIEQHSNINMSRPGGPLPTYFVGVTNVGKSALINSCARHTHVADPPHPLAKKQYFVETDETGREHIRYSWYVPANEGASEAKIIKKDPRTTVKRLQRNMTVSTLPGTTVRTVAVTFGSTKRVVITADGEKKRLNEDEAQSEKENRTVFHDTPGLYPLWHQSSILTLKQQRQVLNRFYRQFIGYFLRPGQTLFFSGLCAIDVVKGPETGVFMCCYSSKKLLTRIIDTPGADDFWIQQCGTALYPPASLSQLGDLRLSIKKSYLFECFSGKHRRSPKADIYFCGLGWVSFFSSQTADIVLRVRTIPGVIHGVREPLRTRDMKLYRPWPRLRPGLILRPPIEAMKVVQFTDRPVDPSQPVEVPVPPPVDPAKELPMSTEAANAPFDYVLSMLQQQGKVASTNSGPSSSS